MGVLSNKIDRTLLKPGDHIYSWRQAYLYAHHGIYFGEEMVIHFTREATAESGTGTVLDRLFTCSRFSYDTKIPCPRCGDQKKRTVGVISSCLDCFLSGGDLYLFEYGISAAVFLAQVRGGTCTTAPSDPAGAALHRALFLLESGFGVYDVFKNNCEDFAIYCKTGLLVSENISVVGSSGQAASGVAAAASFIASSRFRFFTAGPLVGCGMYCISRYVSDIGVRPDVIKIRVEDRPRKKRNVPNLNLLLLLNPLDLNLNLDFTPPNLNLHLLLKLDLNLNPNPLVLNLSLLKSLICKNTQWSMKLHLHLVMLMETMMGIKSQYSCKGMGLINTSW